MSDNERKYYNPSKILAVAIISFIVVCSITIFSFLRCMNNVKEIQKDNLKQIEMLVESIEIHSSKDKFNLNINKEEYDKISTITDNEYNNFLVQYNEIQANWLNIWLTILGLALAFLGLIVPICFMKLYEDKKNEMDKVIQEAKEQKDKAEVSIGNVQVQLSQINIKSESLSNELSVAKSHEEQIARDLDSVKKYLDETRENADRVSKDVEEIKKYVNESKALSKYNNALIKLSEAKYENRKCDDTKYEEALGLLLDANRLCPNNSEYLYSIGNLCTFTKKYKLAIEYLTNSVKLKETSKAYTDLSVAYINCDELDKSLLCSNKVLELPHNHSQEIFIYSVISNIYSKRGDKENTMKYINLLLPEECLSNAEMSNLSVSFINIGDYDSAISIIEKYNEKNVKNKIYYNLIESYLFVGNYNKAYATIQEAVKDTNSKFDYIYDDDYDKWTKKINECTDKIIVNKLLYILGTLQRKTRWNNFENN